jgi:hypothetical protein
MSHNHSLEHEGEHHLDDKKTGFRSHLVGLSLGLLAVMIAVCASVGSSERDRMTQAMIAQSRATSKEVAASVKLRLVLMELADAAALPKEKRDASFVATSIRFYKDYKSERDLAHELAESMDPAIENHFQGTERYDWAQLWAEIALSIGSLSLLLKNRFVWYLSLIFAALCVFKLSTTKYHQDKESGPIDEKIAFLDAQYRELRRKHSANNSDPEIIRKLDPGALSGN